MQRRMLAAVDAEGVRRIGPGMVLAASIVGSGELIATTTLGAQVGFVALWIILVSCAIKPVVQSELGRYTIQPRLYDCGAVRRRLRPHLAAGPGQGRVLLAAHRLRGGCAAAPC